MGRDAQGHGHDPGEAGNPNHGKNGEFSGGGDGGSSGGKGGGGKQAWSKPHVSLDQKATKERHAVAQAAKLKEAAKYKEAKAEDKQFDKTRTATYREAKSEDRARDRAAAKADHQRAQSANAGHGHPITMHAGQRSVGTHSGGAVGSGGSTGGGGSGGGGNLSARAAAVAKNNPMKPKGLRQSAKEGVARGQMIDATHFPTGQAVQPVVAGYHRGGR
jgi:hypothetical protein